VEKEEVALNNSSANPNSARCVVPLWQRLVIGARPKRTLLRIVILAPSLFLLFGYVLLPVRIVGESMYPTYKNGGVNLVNRLSYLFHEPRHGDVVAIRLADEHVMLLKRIVGLPGEQVGFHEGHLTLNGTVVHEPYLTQPSNWEDPPELVETGKYFVVGDNRTMPESDHVHGKAERSRIVGKVLW
jgi:signal peptidase I